MSTEEQVVALIAAANPVPDPDLLDPVAPLDHLDRTSGWGDLLVDLEPEPPASMGPARPRLLPLVAAVTVSAIVGLAVWFNQSHNPDDLASHVEATTPASGEPALLAPPTDLVGLAVKWVAHDQTALGVIRAAVRTPSAEIIGITIHGGGSGGGGLGGSKTIAGRQIRIGKPFVGGLLEDFWTYGESGDCFEIDITMSDGLETPDPVAFTTPSDIETFFQQLTITDATGATGGDGETVTIKLPPGWESLGAATVSDRYILRFTADVDTQQDVEFELDQRPATGVGVFLADPGRSNPRPVTVSGRPAWLMFSTGGWNTLVFDDDGTAVALGARGLYQPFDSRTDGLDEQQLVAFAATLERRPWGEASALLTGTNPTQTPVSELLPELEKPVPAGCAVSLEII